jgi:CHAD domain-containing protein
VKRTTRAAGATEEVEWQFDALDLRPIERWLASPAAAATGLDVGRGETTYLVDVYADTDDWRVYRAGYALRLRRDGERWEATMKSLDPAASGPRRRTEITQPTEDHSPDLLAAEGGPVGDRLRALAGRHAVGAAFEVRTRRTTFPLAVEGRPAAELALDQTTIPLGEGEEPVHLRRVEVELRDGTDLTAFLGALVEAGGLRPASLSKFEAGLMAMGHAPDARPDLGPTEVEASMSVGEVAYAVLRNQFLVLEAKEPGTRLGEDPEDLHDMRVAVRRMRSAMKLFEAALPVRAAALRRELKWLGTLLGAVRDMDVQLERLEGWGAEAEPAEREALASLRTLLEARRARARAELLRGLDARRYERLVARLRAMLALGPLRRSAAGRAPVLIAGADIVEKAYRRVRKQARGLSEDSPAEELHELRIRCKRVRYALEFLEPVYGRPARRLVKRLVDLQDLLGEHQDAVVAIADLRSLAGDRRARLRPEAIFVLGRAAERYDLLAADLRERFPARYRAVRGSTWKDLRGALEDRRPAGSTWPPPSRPAVAEGESPAPAPPPTPSVIDGPPEGAWS